LFRHHEVFAPVDKTESPPTGLPEYQDPQQISSESSFIASQIPSEAPPDNPTFATEHAPVDNNQDEVSAIGQAAESLALPMERTEEEVQEITGIIDLSSDKARQTIRETRRKRWEQTAYIPSVAGGTSKDLEEMGPQKKAPERFNWRTDLSIDGRWLYQILVTEGGDTDYLPTWAEIDGRDLDAAIKELQDLDFLNDTDPERFRLKGMRPQHRDSK
jgi:hypothetical protein